MGVALSQFLLQDQVQLPVIVEVAHEEAVVVNRRVLPTGKLDGLLKGAVAITQQNRDCLVAILVHGDDQR
jgi:hypothetical protein